MLTYSLSQIENENLYEFLYKSIKKDIISGKLETGAKLPSKRNFAKNLNVSTITVETAYNQLIAEGYIFSVPKKGYYISQISQVKKIESPPTQIIKQEKDIKKTYTADFVHNYTSPENFPFSIWAKLLREVISINETELMTSSVGSGILQLKQAISDHLYQFRAMTISPHQIVIGAGTEYLYSLIIQLLGRDKIYAIEDPGYKKISQIYSANNVQHHFISMDSKGINIEELENSNSDIIHISPSHHYPTGIITPISRRYELLGWANESDERYIIEDDYDCEFRLLGRPIPPMESIDVSEKVIYMNTFTKSLAPTIRISYMVLPVHLLNLYREKLGFYSSTVSTFEQYTLARFISEGYFEKHINRMRSFYKTRRNQLLDIIRESPVNSKIKIKEEDSGLHFLMILDTKKTDKDIKKALSDKGINISCLSEYYNNASQGAQHTLIINYSNIGTAQMKYALNAINDII